jgi:hypothetical protein
MTNWPPSCAATPPSAPHWRTQLSAFGSWLDDRRTYDWYAADLFKQLNQNPDQFVTPLRTLAEPLIEAGHLTPADVTHREQLLSGLQYLGVGDNSTIRRALLDHQPLRKTDLIKKYAWGLFQSQRPQLVQHWLTCYQNRNQCALSMIAQERAYAERKRLRAQVESAACRVVTT